MHTYHGLKDNACLPMSAKALEGILSGSSVSVFCADDILAYVIDRHKTYVVNTDNCNHKETPCRDTPATI